MSFFLGVFFFILLVQATSRLRFFSIFHFHATPIVDKCIIKVYRTTITCRLFEWIFAYGFVQSRVFINAHNSIRVREKNIINFFLNRRHMFPLISAGCDMVWYVARLLLLRSIWKNKKNDSDEFLLSNLHSVGIDSTTLVSSCLKFTNWKEFLGLKISLCFKILLTKPHNNQWYQLFCTRFFFAAVTDKFVLIFFSYGHYHSLLSTQNISVADFRIGEINQNKWNSTASVRGAASLHNFLFRFVYFFVLRFKRLIGQA